MEGNFNATLQENTHKVEDSLTEDKEVVHQVAADGDDDNDNDNDVDIAITDEHVETEVEHVSESVVYSLDTGLNVSSLNEDTLDLELKEEKREDLLSLEDHQVCAVTQSTSLGASDVATAPNPNSSLEDTDEVSAVVVNHAVEETQYLSASEDNNEHFSASENEGLRETEVVETIKDMTDAEKKVAEVVLPSTDVVSREVIETSDEKTDESDKVTSTGIEKSLVTSTYEKVGEQLDVQESSSYESAKESFQTSSYVPDDESNGATQQGKTEEPKSFENPTIVSVSVSQRQGQHTTWKSCCGLLEILRHGNG